MSEDDSRHPADSDEKPAEKPHRSWLDRISAALSGEPTSSEDLIELLRDVQADGVIGPDTLRMMDCLLYTSRAHALKHHVAQRAAFAQHFAHP